VPELFFNKEDTQAKMDINMDIQIKSSENKLYMVDLLINMRSKLENDKGEKTVFSVDSVYSALVQIEKSENEEDLKRALLVDVPAQIFPAVRALVLQATAESGFPPFFMQMIDFEEVYKKNKKRDA
jgi:preprotein translocase subunit SecB